MELIQKILGTLYWVNVFRLADWAPSIGMLAIISGQMDLLASIDSGGVVNIKARCLDFIHWLFLMFLNIGAWLVGGTAISWFILKVILLGIIGWQIGVGINRRWEQWRAESVIWMRVSLAGVGSWNQSPRSSPLSL